MKSLLKSFLQEHRIEAGCDEAGRGCLAGPVYAAAVILPPDFSHPLLNDSKQMSKKQRELLRGIIEKEAIAWKVAAVGNEEIDEINILQASITGMHRALDGLLVKPDFVLVDGNKFSKYRDIPHQCIIKGDATFASIAAASVLAKTHRDAFMEKLSKQFPAYDWHKNMGYPTKAHRAAILEHGITRWHRKSYRLLSDIIQMIDLL